MVRTLLASALLFGAAAVAVAHATAPSLRSNATQDDRSFSVSFDADKGVYVVTGTSPATNKDTSIHIDLSWDPQGPPNYN